MPTPPLERSLADWLDAPVARLRGRRAALQPTFVAGLLLVIASTAAGQVLQLFQVDPTTMSGDSFGLVMGVTAVTLLVVGVLVTLVEMVLCVGVEADDRGTPLSLGEVFRGALQGPLITAAIVRTLFHLSMATLTMATCGLGIVVWLMAFLYVPLVFPIAIREGTGGLKALLRSVNLVSWKPKGGPWYGSVDRVVVAYHVVAGIAYALWALPNLPSLAWMGMTLWELVLSGAFDPVTAQQQLVPPLWLGVPVQLLTSAMGLLATLYSQQLYLDLHRDLRNAREGHDLHRALDRLGAPGADA